MATHPGPARSNRELFESQGYIAVPDALDGAQVRKLTTAIDELTAGNNRAIQNVADIFGKHDAFLELLDLPSVLPVVTELLGSNIWVNHSHFNFNPATAGDDIRNYPNGYGWHRDGGAIHQDLPWPPPLLSMKIGFYLTDLSVPGRGQTYFIRNSHLTGEPKPGPYELPDAAFPMMVTPGTAVLFDRRLIHSIRSPNTSGVSRHAVFIQFAYRWMAAVDAMQVDHLRKKCNPVQLQLLGMTTTMHTIDGAQGRSGAYYPGTQDVPLSGQKTSNRYARAILRLRRLVGNRKR